MPGQITVENVATVFGFAPTDDTQNKLIVQVSEDFLKCAQSVLYNVPNCAHRSAALRALLEAKWACVDAIAKGGLV